MYAKNYRQAKARQGAVFLLQATHNDDNDASRYRTYLMAFRDCFYTYKWIFVIFCSQEAATKVELNTKVDPAKIIVIGLSASPIYLKCRLPVNALELPSQPSERLHPNYSVRSIA